MLGARRAIVLFAVAVSAVGARHAAPERAARTPKPSTHYAIEMPLNFCIAINGQGHTPGTTCRALLKKRNRNSSQAEACATAARFSFG
jgi:hypothetical protein